MSQDTCLLLKSRGFQFDRGKNYQKKNCALWLGFAQMRKLKEKENKSSKIPVETLRKTDRSPEKKSKRYEKFKWSLHMLWLIDYNEILAHEPPFSFPLDTATYFEIAWENITSQFPSQNQQKINKTMLKSNAKSFYYWFLCPPLAASIDFCTAPEYVTNQMAAWFYSMSNTFTTRFTWQLAM